MYNVPCLGCALSPSLRILSTSRVRLLNTSSQRLLNTSSQRLLSTSRMSFLGTSSLRLLNTSRMSLLGSSSVRLQSSAIQSPPVVEELHLSLPASPTTVPPPDQVTSSGHQELQFVLPERPVPVGELGEGVGLEPGFDTLGLASWWPPGRMQAIMEWIHLDLGLEWWQTIIVTTICMRILVFPVVVYAQRNMANMMNNSPQMARLQEKMTDARRRGDLYEAAQYGGELQVFTTKKGINPIKNAVPILLQFPFFISMFFGLRGMAYCPVESMQEGGILWFTNLTISDPYIVLPILTSTSLYLQLKMGADGAKLSTYSSKMQIAMTVMPIVMLLFTYKFPAAICLYWTTTNFISLSQAQMLKIPVLRKKLNIPLIIEQPKPKVKAASSKKGFIESTRESIDNADFMHSLKAKNNFGREYDERKFKEAGTKTVKTFKYDPTKPIQIQFKDGKRVV